MKTRTLLGTLCALGAPFLLSACNESLTASKAGQNVPVSFRIVGEGTLDSTELVQVRSFAGDSAHRTRLDSLVRRWEDGNVSLEVPLGQPLEFRFDGFNRRNGRLVAFWNALGQDTLRSGNRAGSVVALHVTPRTDTAGPAISVLGTPAETQVVAKGDSLLVSLPTGLSSASLTLPSSLDSAYLGGIALKKDSAGGWTFPVTRGQNLSLTVVNPNGTSSTWLLGIRSGDIQGPAFTFAMNNGATAVVKDGVVSFVLPYVVDSALELTLANADAKDVPTSLKLGQNTLDLGESSWTFPVKVPVAGDTTGIQYQLTAKDTLDNVTSQLVKVTRPLSTKVPRLEWLSPPGKYLWGARTVSFKLKVSGGDSMLVPVVRTPGLNNPQAPVVDTSYGDVTIWSIGLALLEKDSGQVWARVANRSGSSWSLDTVQLKRIDPNAGDDIAPTLTIGTPANSSWTTASTTRLSGYVYDERKGKVVVLLEHSGRIDTAAWNPSDSTWSWNLVWSTDGDSIVKIRAKDSMGNPTNDSVWTLRRDTHSPSLSWSGMSLHGDTLWTRDTFLPLQALFKDTLNGKVRSLGIVREGRIDTSWAKSGSGNLWRDTLDLSGLKDVSEWIATGTDSAGNSTSQIFHVLRDTVKPAISVTTPTPVGIAKFAFSAQKDTLWISGDTSLTVIVDAVSGHPRIPLLGLLVDSSGVLNSTAKLQQSLTIRQASGTSSLRRIAIFDTLGNASDTTRLVVIGVAPISAPIVKFGNSLTPAKDRDSLPWPKTAHMTCPTGTTLNIGTGTAKDSVIWTTTNLSLSCNGPKIRSNIAGYRWTIRDSASIALPIVPGDSNKVAIAVDASDRLWMLSHSGFLNRHNFTPDSMSWTQVASFYVGMAPVKMSRATGVDNLQRRFLAYYDNGSPSNFNWYAATSAGETRSLAPSTSSAAVRGTSMFRVLPGTSSIQEIPLTGTGASTTYAGTGGTSLGMMLAASKSEIYFIDKYRDKFGMAVPYMGRLSGNASVSTFTFNSTYSSLTLATRSDNDSFVVAGVSQSGNLVAFKYASAATDAPVRSNATIATAGAVGNDGILAEWSTNDLWIANSNKALFHLDGDLTYRSSWGLNIIGRPTLDSWGGVWAVIKDGSVYRITHFKGSRQ